MNAYSHAFDLSEATILPPIEHERESASLTFRWNALHDAADALASLAGCAREDGRSEMAALSRRAAVADADRRALVVQGIDDLAAVMRTGLTAILAVVDAGGEASAAAATLWREFQSGREALCALVETPEGIA
ncbi:hypothetical protein [Qipengyuania spongiae]|uniref:Uncharacterized protein n=1 Tax=Qipengyuania spongiae TaxID=2909673 RepID=A0ABY5SZB0_9SPHN|nr:hypothetical protein [Qipengyuania spongiae]UVI39872.1 hypothetical protein L1F33_02610 [Qipengyuania spongiae]